MMIKNSLIINNSFFNNVWAKTTETSNYIKNRLSRKNESHREIISKKLGLIKNKTFYIFKYLIV